MSGCQCLEELGDYTHCPTHGLGTEWEAQKKREDRLRRLADYRRAKRAATVEKNK